MVRHLRETVRFDNNITVITNDNDYVQLHVHRVHLVNLQGKSLYDRIADVHTYIELKRIMGDVSDNIPAIAPKIGPKTAMTLIQCPEKLQKRLVDTECKRKYELNELLVNFGRIPDDYVHHFIASVFT